MTRWPLKLKVATYCAVLVALGLVGTAALLLPFIYNRQLAELDERLNEDAEQLFHDYENYYGSLDARSSVTSKFVSVPLRLRYIDIDGPKGEDIFQSSNLRGTDLRGVPQGMHTIQLFGRNC